VNKVTVSQDEKVDYEEDIIVWDKLPFRSTAFLQNGSFIAGGYDKKPVSFKTTGGKW